jgi:nucleoside-diphosphate-sugar epimerase
LKALVTGANGFVGAHLCRFLAEKGVSVYAMVRKTSKMDLFNDLNPIPTKITIVYGDITDMESLKTHCRDKDVIFNLAGVIMGFRQADYDRVNVQGYINVCEAVLEVNPTIKRVIMTSSVAAGGPTRIDQPFCEEDTLNPLVDDCYGQSKCRMESAIAPYRTKLPLVIVRPPSVFGPGDIPSFDLYKLAKKGRKFVLGKNPKYHSIVSVEDLCQGLNLCAEHPKAVGETFYFTSEEKIEWGEISAIIGEVLFNKDKQKMKFLNIPPKLGLFGAQMLETLGKIRNKPPFLTKGKILEGIAPAWVVSRKKAETLLGWKPEDDIVSTVKRAGEWYKVHG